MEREKISREEFEKMKEMALNNPIEDMNGGGYRSYFHRKVDSIEIVGYREYVSRADGMPHDTIEYECAG